MKTFDKIDEKNIKKIKTNVGWKNSKKNENTKKPNLCSEKNINSAREEDMKYSLPK